MKIKSDNRRFQIKRILNDQLELRLVQGGGYFAAHMSDYFDLKHFRHLFKLLNDKFLEPKRRDEFEKRPKNR